MECHLLYGMAFGVAGTVAPLVDLRIAGGRLPARMRAVPKPDRTWPAAGLVMGRVTGGAGGRRHASQIGLPSGSRAAFQDALMFACAASDKGT